MFNSKTVLAAALLAVPAVGAIVSIGSDPAVEQVSQAVSQATPAQVDTFALMASSRRLPTPKYDAY
jgi:hypothetical protein